MQRKPKKVGLALGGGGAKGLAHIGVIRVLEEAGIEISFIAGTSMGALVGGWYAATKNIGELENLFLRVRHKDIFSMTHMIRKKETGIFRNDSVTRVLEDALKGIKINECKIPFAALATDVKNGEQVILDSGNLEKAIQASTALPIVFKPIEIDGKTLMDGGFVNPVPADVVREMGAECVIAVDVSSKWTDFSEMEFGPTHIYSVIPKALSVIEYQIAKKVLLKADIVLCPPVISYHWHNFESAKDIMDIGETEARNSLKNILTVSGTPEPKKTPAKKFFDFIFYQE